MSIFDVFLPHLQVLGNSFDLHMGNIVSRLDDVIQELRNASNSPELNDRYFRVATPIPFGTTVDMFTVPPNELWLVTSISQSGTGTMQFLANGVAVLDTAGGAPLLPEGVPIFGGEKLSIFNASGAQNVTALLAVKRTKMPGSGERFRQGPGEGVISRTGTEHDGTRDLIDTGSALANIS